MEHGEALEASEKGKKLEKFFTSQVFRMHKIYNQYLLNLSPIDETIRGRAKQLFDLTSIGVDFYRPLNSVWCNVYFFRFYTRLNPVRRCVICFVRSFGTVSGPLTRIKLQKIVWVNITRPLVR